MILNIKQLAQHARPKTTAVTLTTRLPAHAPEAITLACTVGVQSRGNFYLLELQVEGDIPVICQRCLHHYSYPYQHLSQLAVCDSDSLAENLLSQYESIVMQHGEVDLNVILTDDLHLFLPEKHQNLEDCDPKVWDWMGIGKEIDDRH